MVVTMSTMAGGSATGLRAMATRHSLTGRVDICGQGAGGAKIDAEKRAAMILNRREVREKLAGCRRARVERLRPGARLTRVR
jgi:hypothetical protein